MAIMAALLGFFGYFPMFSQFQTYDDEGDWLLSIQQYSIHGGLYGRTYSQCGPFYYEFWTSVCKIFGLSYNLDTGRLLTLGVWVTASVLFAVGSWIWTQKLAVALSVEILSFLLLYTLIFEPMEPAGLSYVLLALVVIGVGLVERGFQRFGFGLVGVSATALLLTKINIGVLALVGLGAAALICWPRSRGQLMRKFAGILIVLLAGVMLVEPIVSEQWVYWLLTFFVFSVFGLGIHLFSRRTADSDLSRSAVGVGLLAAGVAGAVVCLLVLLNGTSIPQLISGAFLSQRNLPKIFQSPPPISMSYVVYSVVTALVGLLVALLWRRPGCSPWFDSRLAGVLRVAIAAWMFWSMLPGFAAFNAPGIGKSFLLMAPLAWVALLVPYRDPNRSVGFARVALVLVGVLECLETFPVAGSQFLWASVALVPVAVVCLYDGLTLLSAPEPDGVKMSNQFGISSRFGTALGWVVVASLLLVVAWTPIKEFTTDRAYYDSNVALASPGAHLLRLKPDAQQQLDTVATFLKKHCRTFESLPGLNSFYFLSGEMPPTGLNTTQWMNLLSLRQQGDVMAQLRKAPRLCVVEDLSLLRFWDQGRPLKQTPLVVYIKTNFTVVKIEGAYSLLQRKRFVRARATRAVSLQPRNN